MQRGSLQELFDTAEQDLTVILRAVQDLAETNRIHRYELLGDLSAPQPQAEYALLATTLSQRARAYRAEILHLLSEWNGIQPINRLPREIMSLVFQRIVDDQIAESYLWPYNWFAISKVCRHWRNIALSSPRLWTYIATTSRLFYDKLILRSRDAPLTFHIEHASSTLPEEFLGLTVLDRVQHYSLKGSLIVKQFYSRACQTSTLQKMTSLQLDARDDDIILDNRNEQHISLPSLSKLSLTWVPSSIFASMSCAFLRHLRLQSLSPSLSTDRCLELLSSLHLLEELFIDESLEFKDDLDITSSRVELPRLTKLFMRQEENTRSLAALLSAIIIPREANLEVYNGETDAPGNLIFLHALESNLFTRLQCLALTFPDLACHLQLTQRSLAVSFLPNMSFSCPQDPLQLTTKPHTSFWLKGGMEREVWDQLCNILCAYGHLEQLTTLCLRASEVSLAPIHDAFRHMAKLERLILDVPISTYALLSDNISERPLFPQLRSLSAAVCSQEVLWHTLSQRNRDTRVAALQELHVCEWRPEGTAIMVDRLKSLIPCVSLSHA